MGMLEFSGQCYLDGRASDPNELGWMRGAPPPAEKRIIFESDEFLDIPQLRWSLSHMRELVPTVNLRRGEGGHTALDCSDRAADIDALTLRTRTGACAVSTRRSTIPIRTASWFCIVGISCTSDTSARSSRTCRMHCTRLRSHMRLAVRRQGT